jgi:hypothetical protein
MSVEVQTSGSTGYVRRTSSLLDHDGPYTITFRLYVPAAGLASDTIWGMSGANGSSSQTKIGTFSDTLRARSNGDIEAIGYDGSQFLNPVNGALSTSGWHSIAVVRVSATQLKIRINGTTYSNTNGSFVGREATALEILLTYGDAEHCPAGTRITNYKSWTAALSDSEIDAEMLTTTVTASSNLYSVSPMGDASTLSTNLNQTGSGSSWTAGAGIIAGANDPSVTYAGGSNPLASSASAGATASATITVQRNLAAAAVAGALATGALSVHKPLTGAAIGAAVGAAALTVFSSVWRIPTNAPNGTAVHATVFSGASPTYAILAQGTAIVAGGFVDIPGTGSVGAKAFAFVHNYSDNTATSNIRGGPAIATLTSL